MAKFSNFPKKLGRLLIMICDICGNRLNPSQDPGIIDIESDPPHIVCFNCYSLLDKCPTCANSVKCDFESNPSATPKAASQEIRNGSSIFVTTVRNPKRIEETCEKNCQCFDKEFKCKREEINFCDNYEIDWSLFRGSQI